MRIGVVGGVARSLINFRGPLLRAMIERGHEVIACAPDISDEVSASLSKMGVKKCYSIPLWRTGMNPFHDFKTYNSLRSIFEKERPDCVLSYTIKPVIYGSLAAQAVNVPGVFSMITGLGYAFTSTTIKQRFLRAVVQPLYRQALKGNTVVFFQNPDDQALFVDRRLVRDVSRTVVINGSGVDLEYYSRAEPVTERIVFLLIARLLRDKGIYEYVEAAKQIKAKYPEIIFQLVGPLDSNPSAISPTTVEAWHKEGIIEYLGEAKDVRPHIGAASVYVLPSYREGTPRTVLEAMAMGRPIITTDAPGCRETVRDGINGFLVPVKDVRRLVEAMERFIENPSLIPKMGEESWKVATEKYDVRKVNAAILDVMGL